MKTKNHIKCTVLMLLSLWFTSYSNGQTCYNMSGCQNYANFGYNSSGASDLEYDNYISGFHSTIVRDLDGTLLIWGERSKANGVDHWLVPTPINAGNYPGLTGTPLKAAIGSAGNNQVQFVVLTSDNKLWAWGSEEIVLHNELTTGTEFQLLSIGLPPGVLASNVKMFFGTYGGLILTTCDGHVYVLTNNSPAVRGDGITSSDITSFTTWSHVEKQSGGFLTNIVAARRTNYGALALDASGSLWAWGTSWDGVGPAMDRSRAIQINPPAGATGSIKMIGMNIASAPSYYVLYENGSLYAMGDNWLGQLGNWNTTDQLTWIQPTYNGPGGTPMNDIKWISPSEHDGANPAVNVITNSKTVYNWGSNSGNMLGRGVDESVNPGVPENFQAGYDNTNIISVETGGHTTMILKECSSTFGYVGHRVNGSMGDNASSSSYDDVFHFNTNAIQVCGGQTVNAILESSVNGPYCIGNSVQLIGTPSGGTYSIDPSSTASASLIGSELTFTGAGTLRVNYTVNDGSSCGTVSVVKVFVVQNCGSKIIIPGTIWNDGNGNAVVDGGENGTDNGLWVNLVDPNGHVISSTKVNTDGTYAFEIGTGSLVTNGDYAIIITKTAKMQGDPLTTADLPNNGYGYTGVNRGGSSGVDNSNRTGKLNIGDLTGIPGGTTTDPINFGITNDPDLLPVHFADLSAILKGGKLFVKWGTLSEINNKSFEIEVSADGVHFVSIGSMNSKAENGNSDSLINYEFSIDFSNMALATSGIVLVMLAFGTLLMKFLPKRKVLFVSLIITGIFMGVAGCQKKNSNPFSDSNTLYVRIAQIDIDGSKSYSSVVKVIKND